MSNLGKSLSVSNPRLTITEHSDTLGDLVSTTLSPLQGLRVAELDAPWTDAIHKAFCTFFHWSKFMFTFTMDLDTDTYKGQVGFLIQVFESMTRRVKF